MRAHDPTERCELFGEYSRTSDSVTEHDTFQQPSHALNGFETGGALRVWHGLGAKVAISRYAGANLGAESQLFGVVGGQYAVRVGPESIFAEGMIGGGHISSVFYSGKGTTSFASVFGGGLDTPIVRHVAFRVEGTLLHATFVPTSNQIHGIPTLFGRFSTGLVVRF